MVSMSRSGQSAYRAHSELAVVAHACYGHRYWPSSVPLSRTGKIRGGGTICTGRYKGVQTAQPRSVAGGGCLGCYGIWNVLD